MRLVVFLFSTMFACIAIFIHEMVRKKKKKDGPVRDFSPPLKFSSPAVGLALKSQTI